MEENKLIDELERKNIYRFRQLKKKRAEEQATKSDTEKTVDALMEKMLPDYKKWEDFMFEAGESAWFAMNELNRMKKHMDEVHGGDTDKCEGNCLEDFTMEDGKEYAKTMMNYLKESLKKEL
jgi:hypothetical protein